MGLEMLLLQSGFAMGVALLCVVAYKGISSRSRPMVNLASSRITNAVQTPIHAAQPTSVEIPSRESSHAEAPEPVTSLVSLASPLIVEAPPPFEETQPSNISNPSTPLPTDVSAVANIGNPVENAGPALMIARPKRTRRARNTSSDGTTRRKRASKPKESSPTTEPILLPGQQNQINQ